MEKPNLHKNKWHTDWYKIRLCMWYILTFIDGNNINNYSLKDFRDSMQEKIDNEKEDI